MSDWIKRELQRSQDPVDQQRYRVGLCREGEHCGCKDEVGVTPRFEVYQERRFRRERDGFDVLQITLEVSGKLPRPSDAPTADAELVQCDVSLAGEWLRARPWLVRNGSAELQRERVFLARSRQGGSTARAIAALAMREVRSAFGSGVQIVDVMRALDALDRFSVREPPRGV